MRRLTILIGLFASLPAVQANTYIEFGHFDKVQEISFMSGALSACGDLESIDKNKRNAYKLLGFKLIQINDDYFNLIYRVVAVSELPISVRKGVVDEFRKVEIMRDSLHNDGSNSIKNGETSCEDAEKFAADVIEY